MMTGFEARWPTPEDYILGVTKVIWEDRGIATLHRYYSEDIVVRSPASIVRGNRGVIGATMATLAEFPDRQLLGEDVIWSPDAEGGFLSSHRILSTATHAGDGAFGPASGTKFVYRIIADCAARANVIHDEWLIRDLGAIVRQMGVEPKRYAAQQIEAEGGPERAGRPFTPEIDQVGTYHGSGNDHAVGRRYAGMLEGLMGADFTVVPLEYDRAVQLELPGGRTAHGHPAADAFWMGLRSSFPSARFEVHHRIGREDAGLPARAAVRWSLTGKHDGWGAFGAPSGAEVHVMGISHAEFGPRGLKREFVLIDEVAVWKQILLKTG